jgi:hypothetical protein
MAVFLLSGGGDATVTTSSDHYTDLGDYVDSVKAMLARPGTFGDLFPETTNAGLVDLMRDGLAECNMEQLLTGYTANANGIVRPELPPGAMAMVVLFAGVRLVRSEILNRITSTKYVAGPVSAEQSYSTNILRDVAKALEAQKTTLIALYRASSAGTDFYMADSYIANLTSRTDNGVRLAPWLPSTIYG